MYARVIKSLTYFYIRSYYSILCERNTPHLCGDILLKKIGFDLKNLGRKLYQFQDNDQYDKTYMRTLDELAYSQRKICILSARQP